MNVEEMIEELKKLDPKLEITDGHDSLYSIEVLPGYYDGCFTKLYQDKNKDCYNVIGCKIEADEYKVKLHFMGWSEVLENDPDAVVEMNEYTKKYYEEVEKYRTYIKELFKKSLEEMRAQVFEKIKEYKIVQSKKDTIGHYNVMSYLLPDGTLDKMCQGHCEAVLKTESFKPIERDDYIYWEIQ